MICPLYPESLNVFTADKAVGPAPTITIFLLLSTFSGPNYLRVGFESQPILGIVTIILSPFISTGNVFNPPNTGPCSASPVFT